MLVKDETSTCGNAPVATPAKIAARSRKVDELLGDRNHSLPVWIRASTIGPEHYSGFGRSKLYELAHRNLIDSRSIREPGQTRGTRLFRLQSILDYIENTPSETK